MTKEQYNELKKMAQDRLLPLRDHAKGRYVNVDTMLWGDSGKYHKCGDEAGFYALADLGYEYYRKIRVYMWDDYEEKKKELELHLAKAEEAAPKVTEPIYGVGMGWSDGLCDKEISKACYGYLGGTL